MDFHHQNVTTSMKLEDFLRILYPKQDKYRIAAAHFLAAVSGKEEGLDGFELNQVCESKNISRATMQKVFIRLRKLGLIDRRSMKYYLNNEFATATRRLGDAWKKLVEEKKFGFDEGSLKVNV